MKSGNAADNGYGLLVRFARMAFLAVNLNVANLTNDDCDDCFNKYLRTVFFCCMYSVFRAIVASHVFLKH